jgi:CIC family chloride channel protein
MGANENRVENGATAEGLPVAPSAAAALDNARVPLERSLIDRRVVVICLWSVLLAVATGFVARALQAIIGLVTNISFYGRLSTSFVSPAGHHLGPMVIVIPVIGGLIVGVMARYGSKAIRGHGIPEAMENVLLNESRIPARLTFLKPLSAAIAIGTGGPFGAEGPIIATGGALGSLLGQIWKTTAAERKTLLAAGAAAGMAATFGSPVSAVLLAVELLLFEFRPRSLVPVALASATATAVRMAFAGPAPVFVMPHLAQPSGEALAIYALLGAFVGYLSVYVTRAVYWIEDLFERLPIHWMWWPAIGGLAVGLVGYFAPRTLGVGYDNIEGFVSGRMVGEAVLFLSVMKFLSWSIALGSGTSGGTLAPLFTIGGGTGVFVGELLDAAFPHLGIDPRICALVGMAAMFAGASRALLASVVFAFETTLQPLGLLPLLGGCTAGYLVSALLMRNTIMTEKLARRGVRVPSEYAADYLDRVHVRDVFSDDLTALDGISPHAVVFADSTLRDAADHMVRENVHELPVVDRADPTRIIGIITLGDVLSAHEQRLTEEHG